ncbi:unnamed protein product, partial [Timema podura]|nr:unnamed protein product [Timema podura]
YVSRAHVRDSSKHVILGTQQYKPNEFATQINLNMDNAWGILRVANLTLEHGYFSEFVDLICVTCWYPCFSAGQHLPASLPLLVSQENLGGPRKSSPPSYIQQAPHYESEEVNPSSTFCCNMWRQVVFKYGTGFPDETGSI